MKIIDKIDSLLGKDMKVSIHPEVTLKGEESTIEFQNTSNSAIDPEDVIAWLVTQLNANGTLYLKNVVRQYMSALRTAPKKLQIPFGFEERDLFNCHTVDELNAYWDIFKVAPNYNQVNNSTSGMFSAGMSCYMRYLQHLSNELKVKKPGVIQLIERHNLEYLDKRDKGGALWVIGGRDLSPTMLKLQDSGFHFTFKVGGGRSSGYRDAWWYKSTTTVNKQKPAESQEAQPVYKEPKGISNSVARIDLTRPALCTRTANVVPITPPKPALDPEVIEKMTDVLTVHFANGYRLNSHIELARFRSFAAEDFGEEIVLPNEELKRYISACGTIYDGKVYAVSASTKEHIKELVDEYFSHGALVIFFAEFYFKNEKWLFEASVVSENMLIDILHRLFPKLSFTQTYFGYTDTSIFAALEGEILRVWGDDVLLTYVQLAERLQYIPIGRIKSVLGQNGNFIWNSMETFSHVSRIEITDEERQLIREAAFRECNARGYASIRDLPFGEIEERNDQLSITAVHNAIYRICLSDKFDKKDKIVVRKGDIFDELAIMKNYCRTIDKCSLDDLLAYEKELTGEVYRWIPMEAGNTVLVRIDKNTYVADRYVHFNVDIIDKAIGMFVERDYLPLKSFTTFGAFPDCGQRWNLFLLESYCRRFSEKFRFDAPSFNSHNIGVIIHKSSDMDYTEIMIDAVAKANVPLTNTAVGKFLYESGYTGRSTTTKASEIIDKAKAIRESRD